MAQKIKAETAAQRKRRGAANPERTQDVRDFASFLRYIRKHPREAMEWVRAAVEREDPNDDEAWKALGRSLHHCDVCGT